MPPPHLLLSLFHLKLRYMYFVDHHIIVSRRISFYLIISVKGLHRDLTKVRHDTIHTIGCNFLSKNQTSDRLANETLVSRGGNLFLRASAIVR